MTNGVQDIQAGRIAVAILPVLCIDIPLFRCPVLSLFLVLEHAKVGLIARWGQFATFKSGKHCTARFVGMGAVAILAVLL